MPNYLLNGIRLQRVAAGGSELTYSLTHVCTLPFSILAQNYTLDIALSQLIFFEFFLLEKISNLIINIWQKITTWRIEI